MELKVFAFSVDVVSFVKSFEKPEAANLVLKNLLNAANEFYSNYIAADEALNKNDKNSLFKESKVHAQKCLDLLQSMSVESKLLNEKVDLIIEVAELIRELDSMKV